MLVDLLARNSVGRAIRRACAARPGERASLPPVPERAACRLGMGLSRHVSRCEVQPRFARRMLACQHAALCTRALR